MSTAIKPAPVSASIEVVLCCAANFARDGRYDSAERLLAAVPAEAATAQAFDLLGRIYAQQRRYADAEAQWTQAIQRDPRNEEYRRSLRVAEKYRLRPVWFRFRWTVAILLILVAAVTTIAVWQRTRAKGVSSRVESIPSQPVAATAHTSGTPLEVAFHGPLFSTGTKLTSAGRNEIRQIANQFRSASRIEITGHTDSQRLKPRSKYRNNEELGLARATRVALLLHRECGLPLSRIALFTARPLDDAAQPVMNPDQRTVTIRVWNGGN